ncbi:unnamed protein product [Urochloa humidicola]
MSPFENGDILVSDDGGEQQSTAWILLLQFNLMATKLIGDGCMARCDKNSRGDALNSALTEAEAFKWLLLLTRELFYTSTSGYVTQLPLPVPSPS